jgi:proteasome lid subunit RPN8/RPN11
MPPPGFGEHESCDVRGRTRDAERSRRDYRFALDYSAPDGRHLGALSVEPDWQPALSWAYLAGMREGLLPAVVAPVGGCVVPVWDEQLGPPFCRSLRAIVRGPEGEPVSSAEIPNEYLHDLAEQRAEVWLHRGELRPADAFTYRVCAYPTAPDAREAQAALAAGPRLRIDVQPLAVTDSHQHAFLGRSELLGEASALDFPVFVRREVVDGAIEAARNAGGVETGGVLLGRLHRDTSKPEMFLEIAAQIPAGLTGASATQFSFTPEIWAAADAALALRGRDDELIAGWYHSHPNWCAQCPKERWERCPAARPFFSAEDPQAFQVALLISDLPAAGLTPTLFGSRAGRLVARGFHVLTSWTSSRTEG